MKIFVSAAEISSDLQAEKIIRELINLYPGESVQIAGIGGPRLRSLTEFKEIERAENLRVMGFTEVVGKLFSIRRILKHTLAFLETYQPDLILTFDYPDFHFALLNACAKTPSLSRAFKICGIPPKVWVWRSKRIEKIRRLYHAVWVLFPFEKKLYEDAGIPVIFEGNPLIGAILKNTQGPKPAWNNEGTIRLAVMPGSREAEIRKHLEVIPETLTRLSVKTGKSILAEVPVPEGIGLDRIAAHLKNSERVSYQISQGSSAEVLGRNHLGLIKSGTSTLEAATLGCVPVIFYRVSFITRIIFQFLIRYEGAVGLPNILLGVKKRGLAVFPEFLGPEATPTALSGALLKLIDSPELLHEKQSAGQGLRAMLVPHENISERIAEKIKMLLVQKPKTAIFRKSSLATGVVSFLWSSVNFLRRKIQDLGFLKAQEITLPSVLVGNLQAGGAGKTPLVIAIAAEAIRRGHRVGIVSRGYGGNFKTPTRIVSATQNPELRIQPEIIGDEPAEILDALPEVTLGLGSDRVQVSHELEKLGINFLVFDDGFQNLKFRAQKTLLAVTDATPSELIFRDFRSQAARADVIVQTKGLPKLSQVAAIPLYFEPISLPTKSIWLLSGVADPDEVAQFYRNCGVTIDKILKFPDHARFDLKQVKEWQTEAKNQGSILCVTAKDWMKIKIDNSLTPFVLRRKISSEGWLESLFKR